MVNITQTHPGPRQSVPLCQKGTTITSLVPTPPVPAPPVSSHPYRNIQVSIIQPFLVRRRRNRRRRHNRQGRRLQQQPIIPQRQRGRLPQVPQPPPRRPIRTASCHRASTISCLNTLTFPITKYN